MTDSGTPWRSGVIIVVCLAFGFVVLNSSGLRITPSNMTGLLLVIAVWLVIAICLVALERTGRRNIDLPTFRFAMAALGFLLLHATADILSAFLRYPPSWLDGAVEEGSKLIGVLLLLAAGRAWYWHIKSVQVQFLDHQARADESARSLQYLLDAAVDTAVIGTDTQGIIRQFNTGAERMLGYSADELVGRETPACFHLAEEVAARAAALSEQLGKEISGFEAFVDVTGLEDSLVQEWHYRAKSGRVFPVRLRVSVIRDANKQILGYLGLAEDISEHKAAREALKTSEARLADACEKACLGYWHANLDTGALWWSPVIYDIFGVDPEHTVPSIELFNQCLHPEDEPLVRQSEVVAQTTGIHDVQHRIIRPDGSIRWVHELANYDLKREAQSGDRILTGTVQDITAVKQAEISAQYQGARSQTLIEELFAAVVAIDKDGCITEFNHAAEVMFGYRKTLVMGRNVAMLMPRPYRDQHDGYLHAYLSSGEKKLISEPRQVEALRASGEVFPMQINVAEINMPHRPREFVATLHDLTESQRLDRIKSEFIATVSHELRTPLTSISGSLGMVASGAMGQVPDKAARMIELAYRNSQRLATLVNDLLDMERISSGRMDLALSICDINALADQVVEANRGFAVKHAVEMTFKPAPGSVDAKVDPARFEQVLSNLLSNAIKFSPPQGEVVVAVASSESVLTVSVSDQGPGVPEDFREKMFSRFSQADSSDQRSQGGTGLGLSISKELSELMKIELDYTSVEGEGTCFYLRMPRHAKNAEDCSAPASGNRLMIIEDDQDLNEVMSVALVAKGFACDQAHSGEQALVYLDQRQYDGFVVDIVLPDMDGHALIHEIRRMRAYKAVPIVVVSGKVDDKYLAAVGVAEHVEWMAKPLELDVLATLMQGRLQAGSQATPSVLHVEDDADYRDVVEASLGSTMRIVPVASLAKARDQLRQGTFDLVLLDLGLPDDKGWELLADIQRQQPGIPVIVLTGDEVNASGHDVFEVLSKTRISPSELADRLLQYLPPRTAPEQAPG